MKNKYDVIKPNSNQKIKKSNYWFPEPKDDDPIEVLEEKIEKKMWKQSYWSAPSMWDEDQGFWDQKSMWDY